ncbi:MAG: DUF2461 domain-containing protein [Niabella sp.]
MLQPATIKFLQALADTNHKPWFDAHRSEYEAARMDFIDFVQHVIDKFSEKEPKIGHLRAKDCLFRINRDVRFSKDKSPYKRNFAASINAEGKKSPKAGYYLHVEPGNSFVGGGVWQPLPEHLAKIRQEIDYNLQDFEKLVKNAKFQKLYGGLSVEEGQFLSRVPKGYEPDNPAAEYLKHKSFVAMAAVSDAQLTGKGLLKQVTDAFEAIKPLNDFINEAF